MNSPSPYQAHFDKWKGCRKCPLWEGRDRIVLARGQLPCDILFVGEAPGNSENVLGQPFVGPAGQLLDRIVREALDPDEDTPTELRVAMTNLVACFPREAKQTDDHAPPVEAIKACGERLREFIAIAKPKMVICVGTLADRWAPSALPKPAVVHAGGKVTGHATIRRWSSIVHPAAILRATLAQQSLMVQKAVVTVRCAAREPQQGA